MPLQAQLTLPEDLSVPLDTATTTRAAHLFRVHGTLMLDNSFYPDLISSLEQSFMTDYASQQREKVEKECLRVGLDRFMFSIRLQKPFMDPAVYAAPRVIPVVRELLGEDCVIQSVGAVCAYPGAEMQHVHRDHPQLFAEAGGLNALLPPFALTVVVPLIDLDEDTGTTALWEGSHRIKSRQAEARWSKQELYALKGAVQPWPKTGDCYFMDYRLRHTGTPNRSDRPRPILYLVYSRRWFKDSKNYEMQSPLMISREEFDRIPQQHRHLFVNAQPEN